MFLIRILLFVNLNLSKTQRSYVFIKPSQTKNEQPRKYFLYFTPIVLKAAKAANRFLSIKYAP